MTLKDKAHFVLSRILNIRLFDFPILEKIRNRYYRFYLNAKKPFSIGAHVKVHKHKSPTARIKMGSNVRIGDYCNIDFSGGLEIGSNVVISDNSTIYTHNHEIKKEQLHKKIISFKKLVIEDEVWICSNSFISPSVSRIEFGAVIAAGSVLTKDVGELIVIGGNPATKIIAKRELPIKKSISN